MVEEFSFRIANGNSKIKATIIWTNNKDKKLLYQLLKNAFVVWFNKHKKAKGESKINTFVKIYLKVKFITKLKEEIDSIEVKIPSIEKMLKEEVCFPLNSLIKEEKDISFLKILFPSPQIKSVISWENETIPEQIESEKFIRIQINIALTTNLYGDSTSWPLKNDVNLLME